MMNLENINIFYDRPFMKGKHAIYYTSLCIGAFDKFNEDIAKVISGEEVNYLSSITMEKRKKSYIYGRYIGKQAINKMVHEQSLQDIEIKRGIHSFPVVLCKNKKNVQVSISHSGNLAVALSHWPECPVGVDIEMIDSINFKAIESTVEGSEKEIFRGIDLSYSLYALVLWTAKESISKAMRTGFTVPMKLFEIKSIKKDGDSYHCIFKHVIQFHCSVVIMRGCVMSIAYPKSTELTMRSAKLLSYGETIVYK